MPIGPSGDIELPPDPKPKKLGPIGSFLDSAIDTAVNIPKGILGISPSKEEEKEYTVGPTVNKMIQLGLAAKDLHGATPLLHAALPLAIPRAFHPEIIEELRRLRGSGGLTPEFQELIDRWTQGRAMENRAANLTFAEGLRNSSPEDLEKVRNVLRGKLGVDKVPLFRGVRQDELEQLKEYFRRGEDPGIRSFSMEPKVSQIFADLSLPWGTDTITRLDTMNPAIRSRRMQQGQLYKADVPLENILGHGIIPGQRELIVDMKGINPEELKVLRDKLSYDTYRYSR